ncbi:MAG: GtrA family protein [Streptosporangiaceae bacterium]
MAEMSTKISSLAWRVLPGSIQRRLRSGPARQFLRFVPVSLAALVSSQVALIVAVGILGVTAGTAGFVASVLGAAVSYVLSRWAWRRKGRPDLLRETLPFWAVSVGAWTFLSFASHEASLWSRSMGHSHWARVAVVAGVYLLANCVTFAARFVIFHYVLFAQPGNAQPGNAQPGNAQPGNAQPGGAKARDAQPSPAQDELPEALELAAEPRTEPRR